MADWVQAATAGISCLIVKLHTNCAAFLLRKNSFRMQVQGCCVQESVQNVVRYIKDP